MAAKTTTNASLYPVIKFLKRALQECDNFGDILTEKPLSNHTEIWQLEKISHKEASALLFAKGFRIKKLQKVDSEVLSKNISEQPLWMETFTLSGNGFVIILSAISTADTDSLVFIHMEKYILYLDSKTPEECGETPRFNFKASNTCTKKALRKIDLFDGTTPPFDFHQKQPDFIMIELTQKQKEAHWKELGNENAEAILKACQEGPRPGDLGCD